MTSETGPRARRANGAKIDCATGKLQSSDELEERVGSEVVVSSLAAEPEPVEEVKRKLDAALNVADTKDVEWITIQRIGLMPSDPKRENQELIDRFSIASKAVEAWAHKFGFRIVEAFIRPVDGMSSAVFKLDRGSSAPSQARGGRDATTAKRRRKTD